LWLHITISHFHNRPHWYLNPGLHLHHFVCTTEKLWLSCTKTSICFSPGLGTPPSNNSTWMGRTQVVGIYLGLEW